MDRYRNYPNGTNVGLGFVGRLRPKWMKVEPIAKVRAECLDVLKELEDMEAHWSRLVSEARASRGEGAYASFNIGPEDVESLRRRRTTILKLVDRFDSAE